MFSVTKRIKYVSQPRGGYLPSRDFIVTQFDDGQILKEENLHPIIIGLAVDYLTRYMNGSNLEKAFNISLKGAEIVGKKDLAFEMLNEIKGLDFNSVFNVCKIVGFDVAFRVGKIGYKRPIEEINADNNTVENIKIMVKRSLSFIEKYGPIIMDGFTFLGGYSSLVSSGDGDFLTEKTIWDFKVSKNEPTNIQTLQLLMYYIMGKRSIHYSFQELESIGIFNPRLNKVYLHQIDAINPTIIKEVEDDVLCYDLNKDQVKMLVLRLGLNGLISPNKIKFKALLDSIRAEKEVFDVLEKIDI